MSLPKSSDETVLLHNPRCSKSRATLALLEEHEASFEVREYLNDPLGRDELVDLAQRLGKPLAEWVRRKEEPFVASGLDAQSDTEALIDLVVAHPICMERPIVIRGDRAAIGRPPEDVLGLLD